jgi:hypothetical protein
MVPEPTHRLSGVSSADEHTVSVKACKELRSIKLLVPDVVYTISSKWQDNEHNVRRDDKEHG